MLPLEDATIMVLFLVSAGGMFAFGAAGSDDKEKYLKLGGDIASTCHESYDRAGEGISLQSVTNPTVGQLLTF